jgi:hypothetical protein
MNSVNTTGRQTRRQHSRGDLPMPEVAVAGLNGSHGAVGGRHSTHLAQAGPSSVMISRTRYTVAYRETVDLSALSLVAFTVWQDPRAALLA